MQNRLWEKGLVVGIICLFFGASVLPIINANIVDVKTHNKIYNSKAKLIIIGLIQNPEKHADNFSFWAIHVIVLTFVYGLLENRQVFKNVSIDVIGYTTIKGIIMDNIIFAAFNYE